MGEPVPLDSLSLFPSLLVAAAPWTAGIGAGAAAPSPPLFHGMEEEEERAVLPLAPYPFLFSNKNPPPLYSFFKEALPIFLFQKLTPPPYKPNYIKAPTPF